jgi:hypothetical protein
MDDRNKLPVCECGGIMRRDFTAMPSSQKSGEGAGKFSSSLGVHPDQVADEISRHSDWKFDREGRLYTRNFADYKRKAKELGYLVG